MNFFFAFRVNFFDSRENFPIARKLSTRHLKLRCELITRRNWQLNTLNTTNYGTLKAITHELTYNSVIRNFAIKYPWRGEIELGVRGTANVSLQLTTKRVLGGEFNCKQSGDLKKTLVSLQYQLTGGLEFQTKLTFIYCFIRNIGSSLLSTFCKIIFYGTEKMVLNRCFNSIEKVGI